MNHAEATRHAEQWIACWNTRDIEGVLSHFADDAVFHSPKAAVIVGRGKVEGKADLRAYWTRALERVRDLKFVLDHASFDEHAQELFIVYVATIDGARNRACERLRFGARGVIDAEGLYGAPL